MATELKPDKNDFSNEIALQKLDQGAFLLDIRTKEEYCNGHIAKAFLIPTQLPIMNEKGEPILPEREMATLKDQLWWTLSRHLKSKNDPIVVYCKKGKRALISKKVIQDLGYTNVIAWGGVEEQPMKELFDLKLFVCKTEP